MGKLLYWMDELGQGDAGVVGKKCANLAELTRLGFRVPPFFMTSIEACRCFFKESGILERIFSLAKELGNLEEVSVSGLEKLSGSIRQLIEGEHKMPPELSDEIARYYGRLCENIGEKDAAVSVRSAGLESRPGMFDTYLNVRGEEEVLKKIRAVWASAFTTRALAFRINKRISIDADMLGVAVVKMVNAKTAGVGFSIDPRTGDSNKMVIEANWGLGEGVVSGQSNVDMFVLSKKDLQILDDYVGRKERCVLPREQGIVWEEVPPDKQSVHCLSNEEVKAIGEVVAKVEQKFGGPQDVEWTIGADLPLSNGLFLLQTRPAKVKAKVGESSTERMTNQLSDFFKRAEKTKLKIDKIDLNF